MKVEIMQARRQVPYVVLQQIESLNRLDVELYKHAQDIFAKQHKHTIQKLGGAVSLSFPKFKKKSDNLQVFFGFLYLLFNCTSTLNWNITPDDENFNMLYIGFEMQTIMMGRKLNQILRLLKSLRLIIGDLSTCVVAVHFF